MTTVRGDEIYSLHAQPLSQYQLIKAFHIWRWHEWNIDFLLSSAPEVAVSPWECICVLHLEWFKHGPRALAAFGESLCVTAVYDQELTRLTRLLWVSGGILKRKALEFLHMCTGLPTMSFCFYHTIFSRNHSIITSNWAPLEKTTSSHELMFDEKSGVIIYLTKKTDDPPRKSVKTVPSFS